MFNTSWEDWKNNWCNILKKHHFRVMKKPGVHNGAKMTLAAKTHSTQKRHLLAHRAEIKINVKH
jgi:hypothetical protein